MKRKIKAAAVQEAPVYLDKEATVEKAVELIRQAAKSGIELAVFPEVFLSGYPDWIWLIPNSRAAELNPLYAQLLENAIDIPGPETNALCDVARETGMHLVMGVHERNTERSGSSIFNTIIFIDDKGKLLGKHRKLMPTGGERLVWAQGEGHTLAVYPTSIGKLGGLICWENFMPLARMSLYLQGVQILAAPTWDKSRQWLTAMQHIAREGGMFVISCCAAMTMDDLPDNLGFKALYPPGRQWINTGQSCVVGPKGNILAGPADADKTFVTAELDLGEIFEAKRMFDVAGHYHRPDVFHFSLATLSD